jgi:hypothetical protein
LLVGLALKAARPFTAPAADPRWMVWSRRSLLVLLVIVVCAVGVFIAYGPWRLAPGGIRLVSIARADKPASLALVFAVVLIALLPGVRAAFRRRSAAAFYLLAAFTMWWLTLGPDPTFMGYRPLYKSPYSYLMLVPGFDGLRVPARFWTMALVCLSVTAALAVHRLNGSTRRVVVIAATAGLLLDGWPRRFDVLDAPPIRPSPREAVLRLDLPIETATEAQALFQQMSDPKPLYNGYSGYWAPHYAAMRSLLDARDPQILRALASRAPLGIVIDHAGDADGTLRSMVRAVPGASQVHADAEWSSYLIPGPGLSTIEEAPRGSAIPIASVTATTNAGFASGAIDGTGDTAWGGGPQSDGATFTIDLGHATRAGRLVIEFGPGGMGFPERLRIDVSSDGSQWTPAYDDRPALQVYRAAIRDPRRIPVAFPIERDGVRFIRLAPGSDSPREWAIPELRVLN